MTEPGGQLRGRRQQAAVWRMRGYDAWALGQPVRGLMWLVAATTLAPEVAIRNLLPRRRSPDAAPTQEWLSFTGLHADKCAGPRFLTRVVVEPGHRMLYLDGSAVLPGLPRPQNLEVHLDGRLVHHEHLVRGRNFSIAVPVAGLPAGEHELSVTSSAFVVLDDYLGNGDQRPLSFRLRRLILTA
jgi:hypothetical protein